MANASRRKSRIVPAVVNLGIDVLGLMVVALDVGKWSGVMRYFGSCYNKNDVVFTIYSMARRYRDMGQCLYSRAIMIYLKKVFKKFGGRKSLNLGA